MRARDRWTRAASVAGDLHVTLLGPAEVLRYFAAEAGREQGATVLMAFALNYVNLTMIEIYVVYPYVRQFGIAEPGEDEKL